MNRPYWKDNLREIKKTLARFLSIVAILALGVSFFIGIRAASPSMKESANQYYDRHQLPDGWVISSAGLTEDDLAQLASATSDLEWEPIQQLTATLTTENEPVDVFAWDPQGPHQVFKVVEGRLPQAADEIALDAKFHDQEGGAALELGTQVELSTVQNDSADAPSLPRTQYTLVGYVESPLYFERRAQGTGAHTTISVVHPSAVEGSLYTHAYYWLKSTDREPSYTESYHQHLDQLQAKIKAQIHDRPGQRLVELRHEAEADLESGRQEIADGEKELNEAESQLESARQDLESGWDEYESGQAELADAKTQLQAGADQLRQGQADIDQNRSRLEAGQADLTQGQADLASGQAEYDQGLAQFQAETERAQAALSEGLSQIQSGQADLAQARAQLDSGQAQLDAGYQQLNDQLASAQMQLLDQLTQPTQLESQLDLLEGGLALEAEALAGHPDLLGRYQALQQQLVELAQFRQALQEEERRIARGEKTTAKAYQDLAERFPDLALIQAQSRLLAQEQLELDDLIQAVEGQLAALTHQLDSLMTDSEGAPGLATYQQLVQQRAQLQAEIQALRAQLQIDQANLADLESQARVSDIEAQLTDLKEHQAQLEAELANLEATITVGQLPTSWSRLGLSWLTPLAVTAQEAPIEPTESTLPLVDESTAESSAASSATSSEGVVGSLEAHQSEGASQSAVDPVPEESAVPEAAEKIRPKIEADLAQVANELRLLETELVAAQARETQILDLKQRIQTQQSQLRVLETQLAQVEQALAQAEGQPLVQKLKSYQTQLQTQQAQLEQQLASLKQARDQKQQAQALLDEQAQALQAGWQSYQQGQAQLAAAQAELDAGQAQLDQESQAARRQLDQAAAQLAAGRQQLQAAAQALIQGQAQLQSGITQLQEAQAELLRGEREWQEASDKLKAALEELEKGQAEYDDQLEQFEEEAGQARQEIEDAKRDLADGEGKLNKLKAPKYIVNTRQDLTGYISVNDNADQLRIISNIFPVFFFGIAALVTSSTIQRMGYEQRNYMGTMKQLGYSNGAIIGKFLTYTLMASVLAIAVGLWLGYRIFPQVILNAYNNVYHFDQPTIVNLPEWNLIISLVAVACAVIPAVLTPRQILQTAPAQLLVPEPPRSGQKIWLESWPALWQRLSFESKMTIRNLFRYKGRNLMTMLGVAGCSMLIVTGFGISDTVSGLVDYQLGDIQHYQSVLYLNEDEDQAQLTDLATDLQQDHRIQRAVPTHQDSLTYTDDHGNKHTVSLVVPLSDAASFRQVLSLRERAADQPLDLTQGAVMTERLQEHTGWNTDSGQLRLTDEDHEEYVINIQAVAENYISHYLYMTPADYQHYFGQEPELNAYFLQYEPGIDQAALEAELSDLEPVLAILNVDAIAEVAGAAMGSLDLITVVLIIAAASLAFVVLYNLTNISVSERMRELSTIKVLGFYDYEVSLYIFREILVLTLLGGLLGLALGSWLTHYIMKTMQLNNLLFYPRIHLSSYLISFALTFMFTSLVMLLMHFKLKKVDMVEALKAIE